MEYSNSRRDFLKYGAKVLGASTLMLSPLACAVPRKIRGEETTPIQADKRELLPSNTGEFEEGYVNLNEDRINFQRVGLLGDFYFAIPLNNRGRVLNGGEPSFALIPESKARITISMVGNAGEGDVIIDSSSGDVYFPYVLKAKNSKEWDLHTDFSKPVWPVRLGTNFKMNDLKKPDSRHGKISLERMTETDFPFSDETLRTINNQNYIVNRACELKRNENLIPIYFTGVPIKVEFDENESDRKINILGPTYVFSKEKNEADYIKVRGFNNPFLNKENMIKQINDSKKEKTEKNQSVGIHEEQLYE